MVSVLDSVVHCFNDRQFHFESCLFTDRNRKRDTVYGKANQEYAIKLALNGERNFPRSQSSKSIYRASLSREAPQLPSPCQGKYERPCPIWSA